MRVLLSSLDAYEGPSDTRNRNGNRNHSRLDLAGFTEFSCRLRSIFARTPRQSRKPYDRLHHKIANATHRLLPHIEIVAEN